MTIGLASFFLAILIYFIDIRGWKRGYLMKILKIIGIHPLFLYVLSEVVAIVIGAIGVKDFVFSHISAATPDGYIASLIYSILFIVTMVLAVVCIRGEKK